MIGKGKAISHTKASIEYGWNEEKDAKIVFKKHLAGATPKEITQEFQTIQAMNKVCKRNTFSFVLSPTIEDGKKLTLQNLYAISDEFVKDLKLDEHQAIAFLHQDKEHRHIHLYLNRINFKGKAYSDSYISKRAIKAAERVALKLNLTTVKEVQKRKLDNLKTIRKHIKEKHDYCIDKLKPKNYNDYISIMKQFNIKIIPSINKSKKLQGFRFEFQNNNLKGSEVHKSLSFNNIKKDIFTTSRTIIRKA